MNNNTRGFVALLFLEVLVPTSPPPAAAARPPIYQHTHPPPPPQTMPLCLYISISLWCGGTESRSRAADEAMEWGSFSIQVYVS